MVFGEDLSLVHCSQIKGTGNFFSISLLAVECPVQEADG